MAELYVVGAPAGRGRSSRAFQVGLASWVFGLCRFSVVSVLLVLFVYVLHDRIMITSWLLTCIVRSSACRYR
jgi:hypothetical protein